MSGNAVFRRRISFQDIQGRIHIGIRPVPTMRTGKVRLAWIADAFAVLATIRLPVVSPLFQRHVIDRAACAREMPKQMFLIERGGQLVLKGAILHNGNIGIWSMDCQVDNTTGRHCKFMLHVHLVFVTKYRRDVLSAAAIADLKTIFDKVCRDFEAELEERMKTISRPGGTHEDPNCQE